jgi:1-acyl-sn-glycerol-3-phosphate acyltransferase
MLFLRSLLFTLIMVPATMIWSFACMLFAPLPYAQRYFLTMRWSWFCMLCARWICGIRYRVEGAENLPDAPAILLCKHQSAWETIFLPVFMPRPLVFIFKRELLYVPFFGWGIGLLRMIAIDRRAGHNAFEQIVEQGKKRLANGQWIIMFPEGTRIPVGRKGQYKTGGVRLALRTGTVVVPIAVNSGECWPRNSFIKKPGLVTVSIGKPISPEGHTHTSMMQEVEEWIEAEMRRISPHAYRQPLTAG